MIIKKAQTYIVDNGTYYFALGDSAHDALNNILAKKGKNTSDGMDYDGNQSFVYTYEQKISIAQHMQHHCLEEQ